jgi:DNA polymerase IV
MGSYRRGKPASNDIDIVFTHGNAKSAKDLCARLVERLRSAGLVTHVMREYRLAFILFLPNACLPHTDISGFHEPNVLRTTHWDSLEKALTVYRTPKDGGHHQVDLICALPQTYWTAIVGWTGGIMFERDLRSAAKAV